MKAHNWLVGELRDWKKAFVLPVRSLKLNCNLSLATVSCVQAWCRLLYLFFFGWVWRWLHDLRLHALILAFIRPVFHRTLRRNGAKMTLGTALRIQNRLVNPPFQTLGIVLSLGHHHPPRLLNLFPDHLIVPHRRPSHSLIPMSMLQVQALILLKGNLVKHQRTDGQ
jgi:hypothetical protein